jgi:protein-tyrosine-phosphatase
MSSKRIIKKLSQNLIDTLCYYCFRNKLNTEKFKEIKTINFLCHGNICRSAFAEKIAKNINLKYNLKIDFISSGLFADQGNKPPIEAIVAAKLFKIDLSGHKPKKLTTDLVEESSLVIGMHYEHFKKYNKLFPADIDKFYLLKHFAWPEYKLLNISDPYNNPIDEFKKCFLEIEVCIESLMKLLSGYENIE